MDKIKSGFNKDNWNILQEMFDASKFRKPINQIMRKIYREL